MDSWLQITFLIAEILLAITLAIFVIRLIFVPLSVVHEIKYRRQVKQGNLGALGHPKALKTPSLSVVIPAYNEEKVIESCVLSILGSDYPGIEIVIADDGSTDSTGVIAQQLASQFSEVKYLRLENGGKASALNHGFAATSGEFVMFIDADTVFSENTIIEMLKGFKDEKVAAVCGDDRPVNLNRFQTKFLSFISPVGTGLVRRALEVLGCMPVISGNCGTFRRSVLNELNGPLKTDTLGEDLELTWRLHRAGWKIKFAPYALVYAESPSSFKALFRQRVRWARGLLQTMKYHLKGLIDLKRPAFAALMWLTLFSMIIIPVTQILGIIMAVPKLAFGLLGGGNITWSLPWDLFIASGILISLLLVIFMAALSGRPGDLKHIFTAVVWPIYALVMSLAMIKAIGLELANQPHIWNKPERTGVVSPNEEISISKVSA